MTAGVGTASPAARAVGSPHLPQGPRRRCLRGLAGAGLWAWLGAGCAQAPAPMELDGRRLTFSEDFDGPLDVSAWGPSRWIAHTPWNGDFGVARFTDPGPGQAFAVADGLLQITARQARPALGWTSGLLCSIDAKGRGFSQALGYFEARMRFPLAHGVWPAFWLVATRAPAQRVEIDVVEFYGRDPRRYRSVVHLWPNQSGRTKWGRGTATPYPAAAGADEFHRYGVEVSADALTYYLDRRPVWQVGVPLDLRQQALALLVNLAIEPDTVAGTHRMDVDYVRAWAPAA